MAKITIVTIYIEIVCSFHFTNGQKRNCIYYSDCMNTSNDNAVEIVNFECEINANPFSEISFLFSLFLKKKLMPFLPESKK